MDDLEERWDKLNLTKEEHSDWNQNKGLSENDRDGQWKSGGKGVVESQGREGSSAYNIKGNMENRWSTPIPGGKIKSIHNYLWISSR